MQAKYSLNSAIAGDFKDNSKVGFEDGDGLVTLDSSNLPSSLKKCSYKEVHIPKVAHDKICDSKKAMKQIKSFLLNK